MKRSHVSIWEWVQKYSGLAHRLSVNKRAIKEIFVDETFAPDRRSGLFWLWIAYEPNMDACLMMHHSHEKGQFCLLAILQTVTQ
jgi:hypothetical protein